MYSNITGVLLSGGKSSRMGTNKSFLRIGNETIIERTAKLMASLFPTALLSSNAPEEYAFLNLPILRDEYKNTGPLAGIHAGLKYSCTEKIFVLSCDMPLMNTEVMSFIIEYPTQKNIAVAKADGFVQQLCGVYNKSVLPSIETMLTSYDGKKKCKVLQLIEMEQAEIIDIESEFPGALNNCFYNMNTMEDFYFVSSTLSANNPK